MANRKLELDLLYNNPNARVLIRLGDEVGTIVGFATQEFTVGATADYNTSMMSGALDKVNNIISTGTATLNSFMGLFGGSGITQRRLGNLSDTIATYGGTQKPKFSLNIMLISYKNGDNVLNDVRKLHRAIYPTAQAVKGINVAIKAPLGYIAATKGAGSNLARTGTIAIQIGKWFFAPGQLMTNVSATLSKEVISNGSPLYANVTMEFEPWRQVTADEIIKFFQI